MVTSTVTVVPPDSVRVKLSAPTEATVPDAFIGAHCSAEMVLVRWDAADAARAPLTPPTPSTHTAVEAASTAAFLESFVMLIAPSGLSSTATVPLDPSPRSTARDLAGLGGSCNVIRDLFGAIDPKLEEFLRRVDAPRWHETDLTWGQWVQGVVADSTG